MGSFPLPSASGGEGAGEAHRIEALGFETDEEAILELPSAVEESLAPGFERCRVRFMVGGGDVKDFADGVNKEAEKAVGILKNEDILRSFRRFHAEQAAQRDGG